jgi:hypothetical protein
MARQRPEKKREPEQRVEQRVLPMELQVGDRLADETGEPQRAPARQRCSGTGTGALLGEDCWGIGAACSGAGTGALLGEDCSGTGTGALLGEDCWGIGAACSGAGTGALLGGDCSGTGTGALLGEDCSGTGTGVLRTGSACLGAGTGTLLSGGFDSASPGLLSGWAPAGHTGRVRTRAHSTTVLTGLIARSPFAVRPLRCWARRSCSSSASRPTGASKRVTPRWLSTGYSRTRTVGDEGTAQGVGPTAHRESALYP